MYPPIIIFPKINIPLSVNNETDMHAAISSTFKFINTSNAPNSKAKIILALLPYTLTSAASNGLFISSTGERIYMISPEIMEIIIIIKFVHGINFIPKSTATINTTELM